MRSAARAAMRKSRLSAIIADDMPVSDSASTESLALLFDPFRDLAEYLIEHLVCQVHRFTDCPPSRHRADIERALHEGSSFQDVDKTLRIIAGTQKLGCFANAVGPEVVSRMDKPLEAGRRTLEKAIHPSPPVS